MKGTRALAAAIALIAFAWAASAAAQEGTMPDWANKSGAYGIGGNTTLGGTNGLNIRTYVTPMFGIHLTLGFNFVTTTLADPTLGDTTQTDTVFSAGIYGSYKLAYWQRGHLSAIIGTDIDILSGSVDYPAGTPDFSGSGNGILIGLGLLGEWFPTQYLSLFTMGGIRLDLINDDDQLSGGSQTTFIINTTGNEQGFNGYDLTVANNAALFGGGGFTVWFK